MVQSQKMNTPRWSLSALVVLIAASLLIVLSMRNHQPPELPRQSVADTKSPEWAMDSLVFQNEDYGYSFSFPSSSKVHVHSSDAEKRMDSVSLTINLDGQLLHLNFVVLGAGKANEFQCENIIRSTTTYGGRVAEILRGTNCASPEVYPRLLNEDLRVRIPLTNGRSLLFYSEWPEGFEPDLQGDWIGEQVLRSMRFDDTGE